MTNSPPRLTLVTQKNNTPIATYLSFIETCAKAGIDAVQLREKTLNTTEKREFALALKPLLAHYGVKLIINDDVNLCEEIDADGVHLGQTDGCCFAARKRLGDNKLIGLTVDTLTQLNTANTLSINYVGIGTIFPTKNKPNITTFWGLEGLIAAKNISKHPIIAIGGITAENVTELLNTNIHGIAAIGAFHDTPHPDHLTKTLHHAIQQRAAS